MLRISAVTNNYRQTNALTQRLNVNFHCLILERMFQKLYKFLFFQVIFSQASELLERQSSMASSTEEVSGTNDVSTDSKQHDTTDTEQGRFGMYMREFDFLEYELESLEVRILKKYEASRFFIVDALSINAQQINLLLSLFRVRVLITSIGEFVVPA